MDLAEFKEQKVEGREILHRKILETFKSLNPIAIHQFGSGTNGYKDEFSDMDIWITFEDDIVDEIVNKRDDIYSSISPVLIKSEAPQNSPLGGKYSMVIFDTGESLYHVDFYFSPKSQTTIRPEAIFHYGDDDLPRGEWILDTEVLQDESPEFALDFLICMSFIGIKMVVRKNTEFLDFLIKSYHEEKLKHFPNLEDVKNNYNAQTLNNIFDQLNIQANPKQKQAIEKIKQYLKEVTRFYL